VREIERVRGNPSSTCFSTTQHLEQAYDAGQQGCDCSVSGAQVCVTDATQRRVALLCEGQEPHWTAVNDGPCAPQH
jgi:hypothetical protein